MMVTIFKDIYNKNEPHYVHLDSVLKRIQNGSSKAVVDRVRDGDAQAKLLLPVVLFSGTFTSRMDSALQEHSGYIVLDFDKLDAEQSKDLLSTDQYVYSCWVSPSGNGIKVLVRISNPERHRDHFRSLKKYFDITYGLAVDESGINESRACFESYDPQIVINDESKTYGGLSGEEQEQEAVIEDSYTDYMKLNLAARMIRLAKDGEKHSTLLKAAKLCGGYIGVKRMEEEEVIRVLFREIQKKDIDSEANAMATIREGIEYGKTTPIHELVSDEKSIEREIRINDGDMSFISSDNNDFHLINEFADGNIKLGLDTGDDRMDEFFRYKNEFVIINGHSNVGKTTMALYMMVNASVRHGWRWMVYSSENSTWSLKATLMEFCTNRRLHDMTYEQRKVSYKYVNDHFIVVKNNETYSYGDLIMFMEKVMRYDKVHAVFIDPYNSLKISMKSNNIGVHDYHYEAASEFLTFSKAHDIAVWLNMHAVTEAQRRKGDDNLPIAPYAEDTEGGGKFVNRADCFLTIHRKIQSPDPHVRRRTEIHVRKVREVKTGGQPTPLDEPLLFNINSTMTGFLSLETSSGLFEPIVNQFNIYSDFNL